MDVLISENIEKAVERSDKKVGQMEATGVIKFVDITTMGQYSALKLAGAKDLAAGMLANRMGVRLQSLPLLEQKMACKEGSSCVGGT